MKKPAASRSTAIAYGALLFAQTLIAGLLLWIMIPIFQQVISRVGETLDIGTDTAVAVIGGAIILQCCYWARFFWYRFPHHFKASSSRTSLCSPAAPVSSLPGRCTRLSSSGIYRHSLLSLLSPKRWQGLPPCSGVCLLYSATHSSWNGLPKRLRSPIEARDESESQVTFDQGVYQIGEDQARSLTVLGSSFGYANPRAWRRTCSSDRPGSPRTRA